MNKFTNPLENIRVASPCSADWDAMVGNERQRFCGECKLNVYNLSAMTRAEAENLLLQSEGRLCARFYKRADGTVITTDCPVGWQAVKRRVSKMAAAFASLIFGILGGLGLTAFLTKSDKPAMMGTVAYYPTPKQTPTPKATPDPEDFVMGEIAVPTPKTTPKPKKTEVLVGRVIAQ